MLPDIHIVNIEAELAKQEEAAKKNNHITACLFNLIVYSHESRRTDYFNDIVRWIVEKFPCRILFIQSTKDRNQSYLHVNVSQELINKGEETIACDRINIEVSASLLERVPFLIIPNLLPDLPIHLLWGQDPTMEHEIFPHLQRFASRLIFDSEATPNLQLFSRKMLNLFSELPIDFMDLNWATLTGWRKIMAQVFDTKEKLLQLKTCERLVISYNKVPCDTYLHPEIQAIYLQGWLAVNLGWQFISKENKNQTIEITYKNASGEIKIELLAKECTELLPSSIMQVEVFCRDGFIYSLARDKCSTKVVAHISSSQQCELPFTLVLPSLNRGFTLIREVFYRCNNEQYRSMLQTIEPINWQKT
jgi:glucose-6-phosphate dehydrogenase assembly protein OpcA